MIGWNDCIVFILAKSHQKGQKVMKELLKPYGLTPIQFLTMALLATEENITAAGICERLMIDKSTLSGVLDRLEEKGMIERSKDESDGRAFAIRPAAKAIEIADELVKIPEKVNEAVLENHTQEEQLLLKRMLRDIYI